MTFDSSLATVRDRIRFRVGDTETNAEFFPDATYDAIITETGATSTNYLVAALEMARAIYGKLTRQATSRTVISVTASRNSAAWYRDLIDELKQEIQRAGGGIKITGLSKAENDRYKDDSDFIGVKFTTNFHNNHRDDDDYR